MSWPCSYCGVRPDVECPHREADPDWKPAEQKDEREKYKRSAYENNGFNFKTRNRQGYGGGKYRVKKSVLERLKQ